MDEFELGVKFYELGIKYYGDKLGDAAKIHYHHYVNMKLLELTVWGNDLSKMVSCNLRYTYERDKILTKDEDFKKYLEENLKEFL